jgi:hypothetical protein
MKFWYIFGESRPWLQSSGKKQISLPTTNPSLPISASCGRFKGSIKLTQKYEETKYILKKKEWTRKTQFA